MFINSMFYRFSKFRSANHLKPNARKMYFSYFKQIYLMGMTKLYLIATAANFTKWFRPSVCVSFLHESNGQPLHTHTYAQNHN